MGRSRFSTALLLVFLVLIGAHPASAGRPPRVEMFAPLLVESEQDRAKEAVRAGQIQPLPRILSSVKRQYRGQLSDARLEERRRGSGSVWIYRIKWLTPENNLLAITVDARSGRILGVQGRGAKGARRP
ncbi:MAG: hypothetical protein QNJ92_00820 [Alphaproteobacteria bacterium]|nr:hypothetical protein [Alphaproteobacteria bacterium]